MESITVLGPPEAVTKTISRRALGLADRRRFLLASPSDLGANRRYGGRSKGAVDG